MYAAYRGVRDVANVDVHISGERTTAISGLAFFYQTLSAYIALSLCLPTLLVVSFIAFIGHFCRVALPAGVARQTYIFV